MSILPILIDWLDNDPDTTCISLYIEGFKDGRRFIEAGRKSNKPIIALKPVFLPTAPPLLPPTPVLWPAPPKSMAPPSSRLA